MTIKIENDETTLCIVTPQASCPSSLHHRRQVLADHINNHSQAPVAFDDDGDVIMCPTRRHNNSQGGQGLCGQHPGRILLESLIEQSSLSTAYLSDETSSDDGFIDDDSTVSTFSYLSEDSQGSKRVRFSDPLVSEVKTRPRTPPEALRQLFYTYEETQRFRQEYRLERKVLARMDSDPSSVSIQSCDNIPAVSSEALKPSSAGSAKRNSRHRISRVLVLHNDVLETFYDDVSKYDRNQSMFKQPLTSRSLEKTPSTSSDDFFDNDSFWSGSITWY